MTSTLDIRQSFTTRSMFSRSCHEHVTWTAVPELVDSVDETPQEPRLMRIVTNSWICDCRKTINDEFWKPSFGPPEVIAVRSKQSWNQCYHQLYLGIEEILTVL